MDPVLVNLNLRVLVQLSEVSADHYMLLHDPELPAVWQSTKLHDTKEYGCFNVRSAADSSGYCTEGNSYTSDYTCTAGSLK